MSINKITEIHTQTVMYFITEYYNILDLKYSILRHQLLHAILRQLNAISFPTQCAPPLFNATLDSLIPV